MTEEGDYQTGERVQGLQKDVEQALLWLLDALRAEQARRKNEPQQQNPEGGQQRPDGRQPLVPDSTELKLLRRMEVDLREALDRLRNLHPEARDGVELEPALLEDLTRLAARHEQLTELFRDLRSRVGIEAPDSAQD